MFLLLKEISRTYKKSCTAFRDDRDCCLLSFEDRANPECLSQLQASSGQGPLSPPFDKIVALYVPDKAQD